jgi:hypothetical protein
LKPGDLVRVYAVPDSSFHGFTALAAARYTALEGRTLPLSEFNEDGYAVIEMYYGSPVDLNGQSAEPSAPALYEWYGFCFDARDLQRV